MLHFQARTNSDSLQRSGSFVKSLSTNCATLEWKQRHQLKQAEALLRNCQFRVFLIWIDLTERSKDLKMLACLKECVRQYPNMTARSVSDIFETLHSRNRCIFKVMESRSDSPGSENALILPRGAVRRQPNML